jgi:putative membrane protein
MLGWHMFGGQLVGGHMVGFPMAPIGPWHIGMMGAFGWLGIAFHAIVTLALLAFFVWFIYRLVRKQPLGQHDSALEIAKLRYAKGEINQAEFEQIRSTLNPNPGTSQS